MRKGVQENRGSSKKLTLFIRKSCIWLLVSLLLPRICRHDGTWGELPPCPNSRYLSGIHWSGSSIRHVTFGSQISINFLEMSIVWSGPLSGGVHCLEVSIVWECLLIEVQLPCFTLLNLHFNIVGRIAPQQKLTFKGPSKSRTI